MVLPGYPDGSAYGGFSLLRRLPFGGINFTNWLLDLKSALVHTSLRLAQILSDLTLVIQTLKMALRKVSRISAFITCDAYCW